MSYGIKYLYVMFIFASLNNLMIVIISRPVNVNTNQFCYICFFAVLYACFDILFWFCVAICIFVLTV
jgi:hypothetical protein